ncbi:uncharacterized protein LOC132713169 [Ruditapes philippinarum]|uniref:uncharacterized protein LOC132713169 n=1 Tax=Ruditapes philippinarum TaxID=129788 RepID=UPI00295B84C6|nr:uncharacterized protein LOC132713169 [Ruditapes philippinarum]
MEDFLKTVNCNEFQQELFNLRRWLYVQKKVESHDIIANCSSNGIEKAKQRLHFTNVARNMNCANHQNIQCTEYCPDHDTFFCAACRESKHGTCHGIKQLMSYVERKRRLAIKSLKGGYNVRIDNTLINIDNNDQLGCMITSMCMLPKSEVLLADFFNKKLKKLNSSYTVTSYCGLPEKPYSVCYKGKDTAVVSLRNTIQYVNVSGNLNLRQLMKLDHKCYGLACHGDTLYVSSGDTIYKYDKDCKQKQVLYQLKFYTYSIVLSDDGERLYFSTNTGLTTIDCKGNHISSQFDGYTLRDICIAGEGMVLVLDEKNNVHQLDYNGKKHGTVNNIPLSNNKLCSMCFDKERCRLIVGVVEDKLRVYKCELWSQVS